MVDEGQAKRPAQDTEGFDVTSPITGMSRDEIKEALRIERRNATLRLAVLRKEIRERQQEIDSVESRLRMIDESEGLL